MILPPGWRANTLEGLTKRWDIIVVGGGISGAGILREAARMNLRVLLLEQADFASGSSSKSSKMVHGGLRYLAEKELGLVRQSVRDRQRLLREVPGLVDTLHFAFTDYSFQEFSRRMFRWGLRVYDLMARARSSRYLTAEQTRALAPRLLREGLKGSFAYNDAGTDDARLTMRVLFEALDDGGKLLNYASAESPLRGADGVVHGLRVRDNLSGEHYDVEARLVINATGAWSDGLREGVGEKPQMRPLRGTHITVPADVLSVEGAITFMHPQDGRPVFVREWEGATIIGTTDMDHGNDLTVEPHATAAEIDYLRAGVAMFFPHVELNDENICSTWAGARPVVGTDEPDPSKESRDHVLEFSHGMLTVTGGKLTTFRSTAIEVLNKARDVLPELPVIKSRTAIFDAVKPNPPAELALSPALSRRLYGRYGHNADRLLAMVRDENRADELKAIPGTLGCWAEVRWAARAEGVIKLQDLLLRRCRLGFLLRDGGMEHVSRIQEICRSELGWDDEQWQNELLAYRNMWKRFYGTPADLAEAWPEEWGLQDTLSE